MPTATYEIDTHYHLDEIKSVLIDFRNYPNFLSSIEHVDINLTNNPIWEVVFVTHLIRRMQYELRLQLEEFPEYSRLHWTLLEGVFQSNTGSWKLTPTSNGTNITYTISITLETHLPNPIARSLIRVSMPNVVQEVLDEIERRRGTSSPK